MRRALITAALVLTSSPVVAEDADFEIRCSGSCQDVYVAVVEDLAAALNYKALGPAEATGVTGFGVGAFVNYTPVENDAAWAALTGTGVDAVGLAGLVVNKGLPANIDIGAFYSTVPGASAGLAGAELRYAFLEGGTATPALALRGAYVRSVGIDDFDYSAWSADLQVSKGFTLLTPYLGAGFVASTADPKGSDAAAAGLTKVDVDNTRVYAGLRVGLGLFDITPEYERTGDNNGYSLRLGLSF